MYFKSLELMFFINKKITLVFSFICKFLIISMNFASYKISLKFGVDDSISYIISIYLKYFYLFIKKEKTIIQAQNHW